MEVQEFEKNEIKDIFYAKWQEQRFRSPMFKIMFEEFIAKRHLDETEYDFILWAKKGGYEIKKNLRGEYELLLN